MITISGGQSEGAFVDGVIFSPDAFRVDYSWMSCLKHLSVHQIKIDQGAHLSNMPRSQNIFEVSVKGVCRQFGDCLQATSLVAWSSAMGLYA